LLKIYSYFLFYFLLYILKKIQLKKYYNLAVIVKNKYLQKENWIIN
jgi:hypothetical protein